MTLGEAIEQEIAWALEGALPQHIENDARMAVRAVLARRASSASSRASFSRASAAIEESG